MPCGPRFDNLLFSSAVQSNFFPLPCTLQLQTVKLSSLKIYKFKSDEEKLKYYFQIWTIKINWNKFVSRASWLFSTFSGKKKMCDRNQCGWVIGCFVDWVRGWWAGWLNNNHAVCTVLSKTFHEKYNGFLKFKFWILQNR